MYEKGDVIGECVYLYDTTPKVSPSGQKRRMAMFKCKCGKEFEAVLDNVKRLATKSCGCLHNYTVRTVNKKHGLRGHYLYGTYYQMVNRCYNQKARGYKGYGGRGITVCDEWRHNFEKYAEDVLNLDNAKKPGYTLDRENTNGNYEIGNIRWATGHTQGANKRIQSNNTSGYVGVMFRSGRWESVINYNGKRILIGLFTDKVKAMWARNCFILDNNLPEYPIQYL